MGPGFRRDAKFLQRVLGRAGSGAFGWFLFRGLLTLRLAGHRLRFCLGGRALRGGAAAGGLRLAIRRRARCLALRAPRLAPALALRLLRRKQRDRIIEGVGVRVGALWQGGVDLVMTDIGPVAAAIEPDNAAFGMRPDLAQ